MDIREAIIENFGEDDFVVKEMNKRGLEYGIMLAKHFLAHDNMTEAGKLIRNWRPDDFSFRSESTVPAKEEDRNRGHQRPAIKRLSLRPPSVPHYTAEEYCQPIRPSFWRRVRGALVRAR